VPPTLTTQLSKSSSLDLILELSNLIYDQVIKDAFAEKWEDIRAIVDELEYRTVTDSCLDETTPEPTQQSAHQVNVK
jgi:hypothetical protein